MTAEVRERLSAAWQEVLGRLWRGEESRGGLRVLAVPPGAGVMLDTGLGAVAGGKALEQGFRSGRAQLEALRKMYGEYAKLAKTLEARAQATDVPTEESLQKLREVVPMQEREEAAFYPGEALEGWAAIRAALAKESQLLCWTFRPWAAAGERAGAQLLAESERAPAAFADKAEKRLREAGLGAWIPKLGEEFPEEVLVFPGLAKGSGATGAGFVQLKKRPKLFEARPESGAMVDRSGALVGWSSAVGVLAPGEKGYAKRLEERERQFERLESLAKEYVELEGEIRLRLPAADVLRTGTWTLRWLDRAGSRAERGARPGLWRPLTAIAVLPSQLAPPTRVMLLRSGTEVPLGAPLLGDAAAAAAAGFVGDRWRLLCATEAPSRGAWSAITAGLVGQIARYGTASARRASGELVLQFERPPWILDPALLDPAEAEALLAEAIRRAGSVAALRKAWRLWLYLRGEERKLEALAKPGRVAKTAELRSLLKAAESETRPALLRAANWKRAVLEAATVPGFFQGEESVGAQNETLRKVAARIWGRASAGEGATREALVNAANALGGEDAAALVDLVDAAEGVLGEPLAGWTANGELRRGGESAAERLARAVSDALAGVRWGEEPVAAPLEAREASQVGAQVRIRLARTVFRRPSGSIGALDELVAELSTSLVLRETGNDADEDEERLAAAARAGAQKIIELQKERELPKRASKKEVGAPEAFRKVLAEQEGGRGGSADRALEAAVGALILEYSVKYVPQAGRPLDWLWCSRETREGSRLTKAWEAARLAGHVRRLGERVRGAGQARAVPWGGKAAIALGSVLRATGESGRPAALLAPARADELGSLDLGRFLDLLPGRGLSSAMTVPARDAVWAKRVLQIGRELWWAGGRDKESPQGSVRLGQGREADPWQPLRWRPPAESRSWLFLTQQRASPAPERLRGLPGLGGAEERWVTRQAEVVSVEVCAPSEDALLVPPVREQRKGTAGQSGPGAVENALFQRESWNLGELDALAGRKPGAGVFMGSRRTGWGGGGGAGLRSWKRLGRRERQDGWGRLRVQGLAELSWTASGEPGAGQAAAARELGKLLGSGGLRRGEASPRAAVRAALRAKDRLSPLLSGVYLLSEQKSLVPEGLPSLYGAERWGFGGEALSWEAVRCFRELVVAPGEPRSRNPELEVRYRHLPQLEALLGRQGGAERVGQGGVGAGEGKQGGLRKAVRPETSIVVSKMEAGTLVQHGVVVREKGRPDLEGHIRALVLLRAESGGAPGAEERAACLRCGLHVNVREATGARADQRAAIEFEYGMVPTGPCCWHRQPPVLLSGRQLPAMYPEKFLRAVGEEGPAWATGTRGRVPAAEVVATGRVLPLQRQNLRPGSRLWEDDGAAFGPTEDGRWACCGRALHEPGCWTGQHSFRSGDPDLHDALSNLSSEALSEANIQMAAAGLRENVPVFPLESRSPMRGSLGLLTPMRPLEAAGGILRRLFAARRVQGEASPASRWALGSASETPAAARAEAEKLVGGLDAKGVTRRLQLEAVWNERAGARLLGPWNVLVGAAAEGLLGKAGARISQEALALTRGSFWKAERARKVGVDSSRLLSAISTFLERRESSDGRHSAQVAQASMREALDLALLVRALWHDAGPASRRTRGRRAAAEGEDEPPILLWVHDTSPAVPRSSKGFEDYCGQVAKLLVAHRIARLPKNYAVQTPWEEEALVPPPARGWGEKSSDDASSSEESDDLPSGSSETSETSETSGSSPRGEDSGSTEDSSEETESADSEKGQERASGTKSESGSGATEAEAREEAEAEAREEAEGEAEAEAKAEATKTLQERASLAAREIAKDLESSGLKKNLDGAVKLREQLVEVFDGKWKSALSLLNSDKGEGLQSTPERKLVPVLVAAKQYIQLHGKKDENGDKVGIEVLGEEGEFIGDPTQAIVGKVSSPDEGKVRAIEDLRDAVLRAKEEYVERAKAAADFYSGLLAEVASGVKLDVRQLVASAGEGLDNLQSQIVIAEQELGGAKATLEIMEPLKKEDTAKQAYEEMEAARSELKKRSDEAREVQESIKSFAWKEEVGEGSLLERAAGKVSVAAEILKRARVVASEMGGLIEDLQAKTRLMFQQIGIPPVLQLERDVPGLLGGQEAKKLALLQELAKGLLNKKEREETRAVREVVDSALKNSERVVQRELDNWGRVNDATTPGEAQDSVASVETQNAENLERTRNALKEEGLRMWMSVMQLWPLELAVTTMSGEMKRVVDSVGREAIAGPVAETHRLLQRQAGVAKDFAEDVQAATGNGPDKAWALKVLDALYFPGFESVDEGRAEKLKEAAEGAVYFDNAQPLWIYAVKEDDVFVDWGDEAARKFFFHNTILKDLATKPGADELKLKDLFSGVLELYANQSKDSFLAKERRLSTEEQAWEEGLGSEAGSAPRQSSSGEGGGPQSGGTLSASSDDSFEESELVREGRASEQSFAENLPTAEGKERRLEETKKDGAERKPSRDERSRRRRRLRETSGAEGRALVGAEAESGSGRSPKEEAARHSGFVLALAASKALDVLFCKPLGGDVVTREEKDEYAFLQDFDALLADQAEWNVEEFARGVEERAKQLFAAEAANQAAAQVQEILLVQMRIYQLFFQKYYVSVENAWQREPENGGPVPALDAEPLLSVRAAAARAAAARWGGAAELGAAANSGAAKRVPNLPGLWTSSEPSLVRRAALVSAVDAWFCAPAPEEGGTSGAALDVTLWKRAQEGGMALETATWTAAQAAGELRELLAAYELEQEREARGIGTLLFVQSRAESEEVGTRATARGCAAKESAEEAINAKLLPSGDSLAADYPRLLRRTAAMFAGWAQARGKEGALEGALFVIAVRGAALAHSKSEETEAAQMEGGATDKVARDAWAASGLRELEALKTAPRTELADGRFFVSRERVQETGKVLQASESSTGLGEQNMYYLAGLAGSNTRFEPADINQDQILWYTLKRSLGTQALYGERSRGAWEVKGSTGGSGLDRAESLKAWTSLKALQDAKVESALPGSWRLAVAKQDEIRTAEAELTEKFRAAWGGVAAAKTWAFEWRANTLLSLAWTRLVAGLEIGKGGSRVSTTSDSAETLLVLASNAGLTLPESAGKRWPRFPGRPRQTLIRGALRASVVSGIRLYTDALPTPLYTPVIVAAQADEKKYAQLESSMEEARKVRLDQLKYAVASVEGLEDRLRRAQLAWARADGWAALLGERSEDAMSAAEKEGSRKLGAASGLLAAPILFDRAGRREAVRRTTLQLAKFRSLAKLELLQETEEILLRADLVVKAHPSLQALATALLEEDPAGGVMRASARMAVDAAGSNDAQEEKLVNGLAAYNIAFALFSHVAVPRSKGTALLDPRPDTQERLVLIPGTSEVSDGGSDFKGLQSMRERVKRSKGARFLAEGRSKRAEGLKLLLTDRRNVLVPGIIESFKKGRGLEGAVEIRERQVEVSDEALGRAAERLAEEMDDWPAVQLSQPLPKEDSPLRYYVDLLNQDPQNNKSLVEWAVKNKSQAPSAFSGIPFIGGTRRIGSGPGSRVQVSHGLLLAAFAQQNPVPPSLARVHPVLRTLELSRHNLVVEWEARNGKIKQVPVKLEL